MTQPAAEAERRTGYAPWKGERTAQAWRWWVIARGNILLGIGGRWTKLVLLASLIPGIILAGITYFFIPLSALALWTTFQAGIVFAFLLSAMMGARLISEDRRQGAFLAHFSRPVRLRDYVLGKAVALFLPLLFVLAASPLFGVLADQLVPAETVAERLQREANVDPNDVNDPGFLADLAWYEAAGSILVYSVAAAATTTGIVLGISSLTSRARYAGVAWFGLVAVGAAAAGLLEEALNKEWPALLSWQDNLVDFGTWTLGLDTNRLARPDYQLDGPTRILAMALVAAVGFGLVVWQLRRAEGGLR